MKTAKNDPTVWGVFVGQNGDQLDIFNSKSEPFPPEEGSDGYIAIGWPAIGDLRMFKDNYADFVHKFRVVYPPEQREATFKVGANMPWYFAFAMRKGDWVICPCSEHGILLIGKITGDYQADYHDKLLGLAGKRRPDFVHVRKVQWKHVISRKDLRYKKLNQIGQLTVSRSHITFDQLRVILNAARTAA